jgi:two-component system, cell cycle response regulator DivK
MEVSAGLAEALLSRYLVTKILIVDDIEGVRRMLSYALEDDYSITQAANGQEAIERAETERPDVIVMDLDMPVMDGVEATRRIKADPQLAAIKVLAVSGQHNSERSRLVIGDCDAFIEKPFEVSDLVEAVRRLAIK